MRKRSPKSVDLERSLNVKEGHGLGRNNFGVGAVESDGERGLGQYGLRQGERPRTLPRHRSQFIGWPGSDPDHPGTGRDFDCRHSDRRQEGQATANGGVIFLYGMLSGHATPFPMSTFGRRVVRDQFLQDLGDLLTGHWLAATAVDAQTADARLNASYRRTLAWADSSDNRTTIQSRDIRTAQRAWLVYRDAFIRFGAAAAPALTRDSVLAHLTNTRSTQLERIPE